MGERGGGGSVLVGWLVASHCNKSHRKVGRWIWVGDLQFDRLGRVFSSDGKVGGTRG